MSKQPTERKRRIPQQARAGASVDAILDATLQLLEADGLDRLTTNHIAARAGVSIGTIYQYFPDKKAILAALAERKAVAVREGIAELVIHEPGAEALRLIVRALAESFQGSPEAQEALLDASARSGANALRLNKSLMPMTAFIGVLIS